MEIRNLEFIPVIIGGDINAYSIARTFHEEYKVKSLVISKNSKKQWKPTTNSRIIENIFIDNLEDIKIFEKVLINIAQKNKSKKLILFACGDWYVHMILEIKNKLSKYYIIPSINLKLMNKITKKDIFYNLCEKLNIDYPKTFIYDCKKKNKLSFDFNYPIIAKPADPVMYHYTDFIGKKKGFKFNNKQELEEMLANLNKSSYTGKFIIQEFIPGDDSYMRVLTCYCDRNHEVKFFSLGHVLLEEHTPGAIGNHAAIINEVNYEIFEQASKFLKHIKYTGYANFDIKYDGRDKKYKFFEINTRLGRSNFYVTGSGFNTAKLIVDEYIYNKKLDIIIADNENLYSILPKALLFKYLKDKSLKGRVKLLIKQKKYCHPLLYREDRNIKRSIYVYCTLLNQIRKYYKYCK
jgi:D-aspartate ligase